MSNHLFHFTLIENTACFLSTVMHEYVFVYAHICVNAHSDLNLPQTERRYQYVFPTDLCVFSKDWLPASKPRRRGSGFNLANASGAENSISNLLVTMVNQDFNLRMCREVARFFSDTNFATSGLALFKVSRGQAPLTSGRSAVRKSANEDANGSAGRLWSRWRGAEL